MPSDSLAWSLEGKHLKKTFSIFRYVDTVNQEKRPFILFWFHDSRVIIVTFFS